ncbi:MAG: flavin reductase family protein [Oscillospiraceae bacterium]|nr:flavin reductase family protein [Oscillospiraceae bacterium]
MRKNFGAKPMLYPMPVFIIGTYNPDGTPNAMNAAWGGMADTELISICLGEHRTTRNIFERKAFTVSMADADNVIPADYVGIVSGEKVDNKVAKAGWHTTKSQFVDAPLIDELPMALECEFLSYDEASGLLIGKILNVCAEERILTDGMIDLSKFHPIAYDPCGHGYYTLGEKVGNAFSDGKKLK